MAAKSSMGPKVTTRVPSNRGGDIKNSIVQKYFISFVVLLVILVLLTTLLSYNNARLAINDQYRRLNENTVQAIASFTALRLDDIDHIGSAISNHHALIEMLRLGPANASSNEYKELQKQVENLMDEYSWSREYLSIRFDIFILGFSGETLSNFYGAKYAIDDLTTSDWYQKLEENRGMSVLIGTRYDPDGYGSRRYTFKVVRMIYDHITSEPLGIVLMNIGERILYDCYANENEKDDSYFILDAEDTVLSAKDKRLIGQTFDARSNKSDYFQATASIGTTGWKLVHREPSNHVFAQTGVFRYTSVVIIFIASLATIFISKALARYLTRPILELNEHMQIVSKGDFSVRAKIVAEDEVGQLASSFNEMVSRIATLIDEIRMTEEMRRRSDLNFLRAQINPHFIYNTLNSIRFSIEIDKIDQAQKMLLYFTKLLRHVLASHDDLLPLSEEIEALVDYVNLQKLRYVDSFSFECDIDPTLLQVHIPSFILQPIVENAIFHGIDSAKGFTHITLTAEKLDEKRFTVVVQDDGPGISMTRMEEISDGKGRLNSIGIGNVDERIRLCCGEEYGLHIDGEWGVGTTVTMTLPL